MPIHTADKWVLCNNQMPFDSCVLLWKCKEYNSDIVPEEKSKTPSHWQLVENTHWGSELR